jgi:hypothetical protein
MFNHRNSGKLHQVGHHFQLIDLDGHRVILEMLHDGASDLVTAPVLPLGPGLGAGDQLIQALEHSLGEWAKLVKDPPAQLIDNVVHLQPCPSANTTMVTQDARQSGDNVSRRKSLQD